MHRPSIAVLAVLALLVAPPAAGALQRIDLPPGPAERAWAGVGPKTEVPELTTEDLPPTHAQWGETEAWLAWARMVRDEARAVGAGVAGDSRTRARLSMIAWSQGRSDDAWDHLAACTAEPGWMAAVVPYLMPGVPLDLLAEGGGAPGLGLPDGVILRPALPPQPVAAIDVVHGFARVPPREMTIHDVRIGEGLVSIRMAIEYDGVQIDVTHLSGEPVSLWAELPQPPDFQIRVEYLDWTRRETVGEPVEMSVSADKQKRHLFGRFRPRALTWTDSVPDRFDARFARHGLRLTLRPDDPDEGRIRGFAAGLTALFEKPAEVVVGGGAAPSSPWPGIKLQLAQDDDRERKLDGLTSLAEHFALYRMNAD